MARLRVPTAALRTIVLALFGLPVAAAATAGAPSSAVTTAIDLFTVARTAAGFPDQPLDPQQVVANLILVALSFVGMIFIVLIIYGGYLWGTARGNEERVEQGRKILIESVMGVAIIFGAYFVTAFVITRIGEATFEPLFPF